MKIYTFSLLLLFAYCLSTGVANAQNNSVKVRFEENGKQTNRGFKISIYLDEQSYRRDSFLSKGIKPKVKQRAFVVPSEVVGQKNVIVHFWFGEYEFTFFNLPVSSFEATDWIVGVDTRPFEKENILESVSEKHIDRAFYLKFQTKEGKPFRMLVNRNR